MIKITTRPEEESGRPPRFMAIDVADSKGYRVTYLDALDIVTGQSALEYQIWEDYREYNKRAAARAEDSVRAEQDGFMSIAGNEIRRMTGDR